LAVERLNASLAEEARLGTQYERAMGTSAELSSFARLHTASLRVGLCQRAVETAEAPGEHAFEFSVAGGPGAPREARNRIADRLDGALDATAIDALRLLVSEVTTNCVEHAHADARARIDIAVSRPPGTVRVELSTDAPPFEHPPIKPAGPDPEDERGRGLLIVDALAQTWGVECHSRNQVWFELATSA
jgi:anti-sigma regulatory factor (Ser/Thr protein kinase)